MKVEVNMAIPGLYSLEGGGNGEPDHGGDDEARQVPLDDTQPAAAVGTHRHVVEETDH